jgi:hypothetical protein
MTQRHACDMQGRSLQANESPCHSYRRKQGERMQCYDQTVP